MIARRTKKDTKKTRAIQNPGAGTLARKPGATRTVIQYVLSRLHDIGVDHVFGVPGDYSFPINDAICKDASVQWVGCSNELNAAYAADGYARIRGAGALCTTYGVGELSAINGVAGSYSEHLPIFHLVGTPKISIQHAHPLMHHTLGNGEYDLFQRMAEPVVCGHAVMTPQNVVYETERLIAEALYNRRPVYMAFPKDLADQPAQGEAHPIAPPRSDPKMLGAAVEAILGALEVAGTACIIPGILVARTGLQPALQAVIDASGLPFATMFMGKSTLDENQAAYLGMYLGALINEDVRDFVESADCVLRIGAPMTEFDTGEFTAHLDPEKKITIGYHHVHVNGNAYSSVEMGELLSELARRLPRRDWSRPRARPVDRTIGSGEDDPIGAAALYARIGRFLEPEDILFVDTGTAMTGLVLARMPPGAAFHCQVLWGSIGWATPAAFGAAVASPHRRVVLVTGDGAHQLTAQEIGQFGRLRLKPVVFLLNNNGYLIERLLCKEPAIAYNDIAPWRYVELPRVLGCDDWVTARATTCRELDAVLQRAASLNAGAYIEVVTDANAAPELMLRLSDKMKGSKKSGRPREIRRRERTAI
jgi:indolepyruvate decarboxylase